MRRLRGIRATHYVHIPLLCVKHNLLRRHYGVFSYNGISPVHSRADKGHQSRCYRSSCIGFLNTLGWTKYKKKPHKKDTDTSTCGNSDSHLRAEARSLPCVWCCCWGETEESRSRLLLPPAIATGQLLNNTQLYSFYFILITVVFRDSLRSAKDAVPPTAEGKGPRGLLGCAGSFALYN